jgi:hypothetical protein
MIWISLYFIIMFSIQQKKREKRTYQLYLDASFEDVALYVQNQ